MAFDPRRLAASLEECVASLDRPVAGACVALSGGLDSTALVAALAALRESGQLRFPLRALHVDHGLHEDSARWAAHCARLAARLAVPLDQVRVDARPGRGESPEAAARAARYAVLGERLAPDELLLTAHHADDQLETILLQWLRGGGLRALAGMRPAAPFAVGWHARPLLGYTRADLESWARATGLDWLKDPSNLDPRFDRNYLRLEVLPALRGRWPAAARTVARAAAQAAETLEAEEALASTDLDTVAEGETLSLAGLRALPASRQRWVLRAWLRRLGLPVPAAATLEALRRDSAVAAADRVPTIDWPGAAVFRYRGRLFATADRSRGAVVSEGRWMPGTAFDLGELGQLELVPAVGVGLSRSRLPGSLLVTARVDGARFRPAGGAHARPLRKWYQEQGVLPWRRQAIPLVQAEGEIVAIGNLAYGAACAACPGEASWAIRWRGRPVLTEDEALGRAAAG